MVIALYVQPNAKKTELAGEYNGCQKLKVNAPPSRHAANDAAINFIAESLGIPKSAVTLVKGEKSRLKSFSFDESLLKNKNSFLLRN
ncbi:MAG: DUF167 domain-containing protein [Deferribacteraceae bacterium]|jgi:uncharacterized protein (TIGR00251 family)|nr:DUF167 domain-containing protein [Deferribacteraceae bacterium]